jgi:uncharacterized RDD family membrane protein YckC
MKATGAARLILLCAALLFMAGASDALAAGLRQDLLAHGSREKFWVARVSTAESENNAPAPPKTQVYARSVGDSQWLPVTQVEGRVVGMAHRGPQLALLLADGDWLLVSEEALVTGRYVPGDGQIIDLASDQDTLLALVRFRLPAPAGPTTTATGATPTTTATTAPTGPARLALYSLTDSGWVERADLSGATQNPWSDVSLAVVDSTIYVAARDRDERGLEAWRLSRLGADGRWGNAAAFDPPAGAAAFELLGGGPVPVLWAMSPTGAYSLHWFGTEGVRSEVVPPPPGVKPGEVAAAMAIERVRVLYYDTAGKLLENAYDALPPAAPAASRPASAPPTRIMLPGRSIPPGLARVVNGLLTVALLFTIVASLRRHRQMQEAMSSARKLPLAPPGRRLIAGLIDAAPLLAAAGVAALRKQQMDDPGGAWDDTIVRAALISGVSFYFAHTTVTELLLGRTVGKLVCGLRVVGLDGERPGPGPLVIRNLLRIIDVLIAFFPLVLVLYSPLRQRAGDVAAGTLVVLSKAGAEAEPVDEEKEKSERPAEVDVTG